MAEICTPFWQAFLRAREENFCEVPAVNAYGSSVLYLAPGDVLVEQLSPVTSRVGLNVADVYSPAYPLTTSGTVGWVSLPDLMPPTVDFALFAGAPEGGGGE